MFIYYFIFVKVILPHTWKDGRVKYFLIGFNHLARRDYKIRLKLIDFII